LQLPKASWKVEKTADTQFFDATKARKLHINNPVSNSQRIPGFKRTGYHCYANALLQNLFNMPGIKDIILDNPAQINNLKSLFRGHIENKEKVLDPKPVISDAGAEFVREVFNCPATFLENLVIKYKKLRTACKVEQESEVKCRNRDCYIPYTHSSHRFKNTFMEIHLRSGEKKATTIQKAVDNALDKNINCDRCNGKDTLNIKRHIISASEYLILKLFNSEVGIQAGPNNILALKVQGNTIKYKLGGAVMFYPNK
jgi:hypothetical protein